ncbi:MAG: hypothetical protein MPW14_03665 [Candidatus Manganitrophus sp.]|nr:hypothetical protein [Candidatus Manganitrophus sp.]WDT71736.1 MAG: hypothetical protein MPW17_02515 [Candidatus Manganitrophus sp.]WDT80892.1 MAG: hypothetical protein MPW14_03665 [Candidatus Manganitrophus sp.]
MSRVTSDRTAPISLNDSTGLPASRRLEAVRRLTSATHRTFQKGYQARLATTCCASASISLRSWKS